MCDCDSASLFLAIYSLILYRKHTDEMSCQGHSIFATSKSNKKGSVLFFYRYIFGLVLFEFDSNKTRHKHSLTSGNKKECACIQFNMEKERKKERETDRKRHKNGSDYAQQSPYNLSSLSCPAAFHRFNPICFFFLSFPSYSIVENLN